MGISKNDAFGGYDVICSDCGVHSGFGISEIEYQENPKKWDDWKCDTCLPPAKVNVPFTPATFLRSHYLDNNEDAQAVHLVIKTMLKMPGITTVDFDGIEYTAVCFLNVAIGQLFGEFEIEFLRKHLKFKCVDNEIRAKIRDVISTAIAYYAARPELTVRLRSENNAVPRGTFQPGCPSEGQQKGGEDG